MKLWAVSMEIEMNVIAETEDEAERIAARSVREEDADSLLVVSVREGVAAAGWTNTCIPYGEVTGHRRNVGQWLAAPTGGADR
jgi:hypothetical protein